MPPNPFIEQARTQQFKRGDIKVDDIIKATWKVEPQFGSGKMEFKGRCTGFDGRMLTATDNDGVQLRHYIDQLESLEVVASNNNPFLTAA